LARVAEAAVVDEEGLERIGRPLGQVGLEPGQEHQRLDDDRRRSIGTRLAGFKTYLAQRPADSLKSLLVNDSRFRDTRQAVVPTAKPGAWSIT